MTRIACVCSGLGYVPRGFERYTRELFDTVRDEADAMLVGAAVSGPRELALRVPHRDGALRRLGTARAYQVELLSFAARLLPHLRDVELVHYSEPYLGNVLAAARSRLRLRYRLLLTDGLGLTVRSSSRADYLHVLTPLAREAALAGGRAEHELFTIPYGIRTGAFATTLPAEEARRELGLPGEGRLLLAVAAVNARHKRVDWLLEEAARLPADWRLAVVGAPEEPELLDRGRALLGPRFHHLTLPTGRMPVAYAAADVFAHAALEEGFLLSAVEAMAAGLPVVLHRSRHFHWLVGDDAQLVDMTERGALAAAVAAAAPAEGLRNRRRAADFDWSRLAADYQAMYDRILAG